MNIIPQKNIIASDIADALRSGQTIVYPTETCYGLGCDATNAAAVEKIFSIKGRESDKPLLIIAECVEQIKNIVEWNETMEKLARKHWPGPLTIVAKVQNANDWPRGIVGSDNTLAFRVSNNQTAQEICRALGRPIVSTSANKAGDADSYSFSHIVETLGNGEVVPDIFIDAGDLPQKPASTIVRVIGDQITVLRQGSIVI